MIFMLTIEKSKLINGAHDAVFVSWDDMALINLNSVNTKLLVVLEDVSWIIGVLYFLIYAQAFYKHGKKVLVWI